MELRLRIQTIPKGTDMNKLKKHMMALAIALAMLATVTSANAFVVTEDFETGDTTGWTTAGQVGVQGTYVYDGNFSAWLGTVDHDGNDLNDITGDASVADIDSHELSQVVDISNPSYTEIWVHYDYYTWDYDTYDDPGFQVLVEGIVVHSRSAGELSATDDGILENTGWTTFVIDLSAYATNTITIEFNAGNSVDDLYQSWAYVELTSVPVPASVWLLGSALGMLGWRFRRQS